MSLKDLLPQGTFDEITEGLPKETQTIECRCPQCGKVMVYDVKNPFRPFCSEKCKLLDLGAWASEERVIKGRPVNEDEDAELLDDPTLPKRHIPEN
jgi:endogenous inhibitor of DNA gyrase (YacG/DUF329 family)